MFLNLDIRPAQNEAIVDGNGIRITYGELRDFCDTFRLNVPQRELIFIICENAAGACAGYVAALNGNIVPLLLERKLDPAVLKNFIETYHPAYIWAPEDFVVFENTQPSFKSFGYGLTKTGHVSPKMAEELALLLPTSGSTGSPKLVRHTLQNVEANARAVSEAFEMNEQSRGMVSLPINFTQGLNVASSHIYAGGTALLTTATLTMPEFWNFMRKERAESFTGVPFTYQVLEKIRFFKMDLPDLKVINQGGGRLTDDLYNKCAEYAQTTGRRFIPTYGSTETTSRMAYLPWQISGKKTGSIGRALPGYTMQLIDDDGKEITTPGIDGEIVFHGANVTLGYAEKDSDLLKGDERHGVYATGDIAHKDEDGCFYIVGRKSRFLKLFGYRIGLDEMERHIKSNLNLTSACAGTDKCLKVFLEEENAERVDEVKALLAKNTDLHKEAYKVLVIEKFPRNNTGKILYSQLNQLGE